MTLHSGVTHPSKEYGAIDLKVEGEPYLNLLQCRSIDKLATDVSAMKIDRSLDRDEIIHFIQTHRGFRTIDNPIVGIYRRIQFICFQMMQLAIWAGKLTYG